VTVLADRYELAEELGTGGMGRVVVAHDRLLGRDVAIKLLGPTPDEVARERFSREARSAARLHHPNIVGVYDTGVDGGRPYLVMELVRGRSLADLLKDEGPLEADQAVAITLGVLEGLEAAHRAGMVHRDVKPANVLLPDDGGVKLSDFGIAKALDETATGLTTAGSLVGTPTYLAPELVGGSPPSPASDVYSVGCLLYAQLTGDPPFTEGEPLAIAYAHRNEPVPPIEDARPDLPPDLVAVVGRALAKDPSDRYERASDMRTALLEGPGAVPLAGTATVAVQQMAPDRTQVLDEAQDPTRAIGPAASAPAPVAPRRGRRWVTPLLVTLALIALLVAAWLLLTRADDPLELDEDPGDVDEAPQEAPVDDPPPDEPAEEPPAEPEAPEEEPEEEPDAPTDEPAEPEPDEEPAEEPPPEEETQEPPVEELEDLLTEEDDA
jgi:eukaryotic-like serine/threonine-protein kinase